MKVGNVVMLKDDNLPRNQWRLGQVSEAKSEDDGLVWKETVRVVTKSLDEKGKVVCSVTHLERPVHKLVLLKESDE